MKLNKDKNHQEGWGNGLILAFLVMVLTIPSSWATDIKKPNTGAVFKVPEMDAAITVEWVDTIGVEDWMRAGLSRSAQVRQSEARTQQAKARAGEARAEMLPMLSLRHAKGRETSTGQGREPDRHSTSSEAIRLTQNLFNAPAMMEWASANRQLSAAQWRQVAREQQDAQQLAQAVIDMTSALKVLEHAQQNMQELEDLLKYIDARTSAGLGSTMELERARGRVLAAQQVQVELQSTVRNRLVELATKTGVMGRQVLIPSAQDFGELPQSLEHAQAKAAQHNPLVLAMRQDIEAIEKQVAAVKGRLLPVVGLSLEQDQTENIRGTNPKAKDRRVMVVATWNLSLGGREFYAVQQVGSNLSEKTAELDDLLQKMSLLVQADWSLLEAATTRERVAANEVESAKAVMAGLREQLAVGRIGSLLEALDTTERLFAAHQRHIQATQQALLAKTQLLLNMGEFKI
jgi:outer membrane protein TolC